VNGQTIAYLPFAPPVPYDTGCAFTKLMLGAPSSNIVESDETAVVDAAGDHTFTVANAGTGFTFSISLKYYFTDGTGVVINTIPAAGAAAATVGVEVQSQNAYRCATAAVAIGSTSKAYGRAASNTASVRTLLAIWGITVSNPDRAECQIETVFYKEGPTPTTNEL
jgi:hypothetical protein